MAFMDTDTYFDAGTHKTKDSLRFSLSRAGFLAQRAADQSVSYFPISTTKSNQATQLTLVSVRPTLQQVTKCREI